MYKGQIITNCNEEQVHSGRGNCEFIPGKTVKLLLTAPNARYPRDPDTFNTALAGYITADGVLRIIPVGPISGNDPTGGDLATSELGNYGGNVTSGLNPSSVSYQIENGSACMYKELSKLNKRQMRIFQVDDSDLISGTVLPDGENDAFGGFLGTVYVREVEATGTTPYQLFINIDYSTKYEKEKQNRHSFPINDVPEGLVGITLKAGTTAGTATVVTTCGGTDITADYGEEWDTSMFVTAAGGNPTTVTYAAGVLTIAPAGSYRIANASVLSAGDVTGYEGINQYTTITSA